jgi:hypothetical protein
MALVFKTVVGYKNSRSGQSGPASVLDEISRRQKILIGCCSGPPLVISAAAPVRPGCLFISAPLSRIYNGHCESRTCVGPLMKRDDGIVKYVTS